MVADPGRASTGHRARIVPPDLHHVVGHQAVAAADQVQGTLALPGAALSQEQDADPVDVHQHPVQRGLGARLGTIHFHASGSIKP